MRPILYKQNASPPARAVMMVIDILGIDVDLQDLNPVFREQDAPEFKKKNPMRTIPIYDEGDFWMADSHAIIIYLIEKYGKPQHSHLYPADPRKRAVINQRLFFDCGVLFPRLRSVMAPTYMQRLGEMSKSMIRNINDAYSMLEDYLSENLYMADNVITIADISVVSTIGTLCGLVPIDGNKYPKLNKWLQNMNEQEYCKKINIPGGLEHSDGLKILMEMNKHNQAQAKAKSKL
ncbi:glutathione S-transferase 1-like [Trichoplusia ni]|uniref:Glutathione S-transferase 1-like n=1 Tax=Trichoplusia ni TaxID=7111 RepID=A0A7E5WJU8_TRINI|nr:glutathione S-transferase 1-like [Trichoplusia ni]XP_026740969.1 glutathione S-transferase 1-like [Trichoplusia ni]XP_026740970.1 glutathione S-transferase 1-like [Trichoplusia ni]